ncbi:peptidoglycan editing factor PgeF [Clostridium hydrogeniformans]|uniref:peptidoglycan editing factor PgeF n=1 Tax=Clostridium hydrogeniformans TaxID=349933 RepID=UPI000483C7EA|nr:peptidoglycan editing factor PgeF [Clostridium hydrogeniformans]
MEIINLDIERRLIEINFENATMVFSTAEGDLDFRKNKSSFKENIEEISKYYGLKDIKTLSQIHSSIVLDIKEEGKEGDGLITNEKYMGIGILTADCVPLLLYDEKNKIIGAVHSGWKGTLDHISLEAVDKMIEVYNCNPNDIKAVIGPHNRECCYEFGEELIEKFLGDKIFKKGKVKENRNLNVESCIIQDLKYKGLKEENIKSLELCTYCNKELKFHSYRKNREDSGRLLSLIFMK